MNAVLGGMVAVVAAGVSIAGVTALPLFFATAIVVAAVTLSFGAGVVLFALLSPARGPISMKLRARTPITRRLRAAA